MSKGRFKKEKARLKKRAFSNNWFEFY